MTEKSWNFHTVEIEDAISHDIFDVLPEDSWSRGCWGGMTCLDRWCLRYLEYFSKELLVSSFSSLELELWLLDNRLAIWLANCRLLSSLYFAIRRSDAVPADGYIPADCSLLILLLLVLYRGSLLLPKLVRSEKKRRKITWNCAEFLDLIRLFFTRLIIVSFFDGYVLNRYQF